MAAHCVFESVVLNESRSNLVRSELKLKAVTDTVRVPVTLLLKRELRHRLLPEDIAIAGRSPNKLPQEISALFDLFVW
jgi:hypothetical protein